LKPENDEMSATDISPEIPARAEEWTLKRHRQPGRAPEMLSNPKATGKGRSKFANWTHLNPRGSRHQNIRNLAPAFLKCTLDDDQMSRKAIFYR
jgi:hypothetical protein